MKKKADKNYARIDKEDLKPWKIPFQFFATYCFMYPLTSLFYNIKFFGRENVPKKGQIICAPNHISYCDPFLTFMVINRPTAFMAKKELFEIKHWFAEVLRGLVAFAVNREKLEIATMKSVKTIAQSKFWNLCIFPQGGICRNKKIDKINRGFIFIAKKAKTDILPIAITGAENEKLFDLKKLFSGKIEVKIGTPVSYMLDDEEIINEWAKQISQMSGYENCLDGKFEPNREDLAETNV